MLNAASCTAFGTRRGGGGFPTRDCLGHRLSVDWVTSSHSDRSRTPVPVGLGRVDFDRLVEHFPRRRLAPRRDRQRAVLPCAPGMVLSDSFRASRQAQDCHAAGSNIEGRRTRASARRNPKPPSLDSYGFFLAAFPCGTVHERYLAAVRALVVVAALTRRGSPTLLQSISKPIICPPHEAVNCRF